jgi:predicted molibdopterin-dependent oxidoreductase YjgC
LENYLNNKDDLRVAGNNVTRNSYVTVTIDGCEIQAPAGEILAVTLFVNGYRTLKYSPRIKEPRGFFCLMGSCQECVVLVDETITPACQKLVQEGIIVKTIKI